MPGAANRAHAVVGALALFVVVAAFALPLWARGAFLPSWVNWDCAQIAADLDGDGADDALTLGGRQVLIRSGDGAVYRTPRGWLVSDAFVGDVTRDGSPEVMLVLWKRGSYGTSKPFWVARNDSGFSQHIGIFSFSEGALQPAWVSSALDVEARSVSLDSRGHVLVELPSGEQSEWEWGSWGLVHVGDEELGDAAAASAPVLGTSSGMVTSTADGGSSQGGDKQATRSTAQGDDGRVASPVQGDGQAAGLIASSSSSRAGGSTGAPVQSVVFLAAGDVIAHESLYENARVDGSGSFDFAPVFSPIEDVVKSADIASVVQETPFVNDASRYAGYPFFGTPTALGDAFVNTGFDVICAATNHMYDQGEQGLGDTIGYWRRHEGMRVLGIHASREEAAAPCIVERNGIRMALFDYTFNLNGFTLPEGRDYEIDVLGEGKLASLVEQAEQQADATVCFLHIGDEYSAQPSSEQRALCERLVAAGADVVVCSHAHVLQPVEELETENGNRAVVYWGLGNLASAQMVPETVLGGMARFVISKDGAGTRVSAHELLPAVCHLEPGLTQVYLLEDYTDELAARHFLNTVVDGNPVSREALHVWF